jgi:hypothetical protein
MKQLLLFALAMSIAAIGHAQNNVAVTGTYKVNQKPVQQVKIDPDVVMPGLPVNPAPSPKATDVVQKFPVGSSANIYTMLVENQSCLDADAATGLLSFTHRANPNVIGAASGDIVVSYSANDGWDWTSYLTLKQDATHANRYPSGVIYNPAGNTDPDGAYVVYCGPSHNAGAWDNTFVGSIKMDSTNVSNGGINSHGALIRMGLVEAAGDFHVMGSAYQSSPYSLDTAYMYNGTWNSTSNSVDWSVAKFKPTFVEEASSGDAFAYVWNFNSAWSNDGMTGYFWTVGRDSSNDTRSYQPIVWKSTDAGANWAKMPVFDFSTVTAFSS